MPGSEARPPPQRRFGALLGPPPNGRRALGESAQISRPGAPLRGVRIRPKYGVRWEAAPRGTEASLQRGPDLAASTTPSGWTQPPLWSVLELLRAEA
eukprot:306086-Alexandrium_andersonii.AAC.1